MKKVIKLKEKDIEQLVRKIINESELNEVWEPTLPNKSPNSTSELLRNEFVEFSNSKDNHMSEVRDIINRVAKLEKTDGVNRYLDELHKYYTTLDDVPANLMVGNIKYKYYNS